MKTFYERLFTTQLPNYDLLKYCHVSVKYTVYALNIMYLVCFCSISYVFISLLSLYYLWRCISLLQEAAENRCLFCGEIIPEGLQVCPICEQRLSHSENICSSMIGLSPGPLTPKPCSAEHHLFKRSWSKMNKKFSHIQEELHDRLTAVFTEVNPHAARCLYCAHCNQKLLIVSPGTSGEIQAKCPRCKLETLYCISNSNSQSA